LAVARFKSDASKPEPDPIVYLEGGPGGSPLKGYPAQFDAIFGPLAAKRDVILFDQRGTGIQPHSPVQNLSKKPGHTRSDLTPIRVQPIDEARAMPRSAGQKARLAV
jgi:pimeloyl-ACP methyl ester carboxylesterase